MSTDIVSKMMAMVAVEPSIKRLMDRLLSRNGSHIRLMPPDVFVPPGERVCFFELSLIVLRSGSVRGGGMSRPPDGARARASPSAAPRSLAAPVP